MTVRYVAVCDGCGKEKGHSRFDDWGQVKVREPGRVIESVRQYDFCSQTCLEAWWHQVSCAVDLGVPASIGEADGGR